MRWCVVLFFFAHFSFLCGMEQDDSSQEANDTYIHKVGELIVAYAQNGISSTPISLMRVLSTQASLPLVRLIAERDCVNNYDASGFPPLYYALKQKKFDCAKYLLQHNADINIKILNKAYWYAQSLNPTLLTYFTEQKNSSDILAWLLRNGAKINAQDDYCNTALHYACLSNCAQNVKILCDFGADVNKINNDGSTPLHKALHKTNDTHLETVIYLTMHGASLTIKNNYRVTPLDMLQGNNNDNRIIRSYLEWENQKSFSGSQEKKSLECPEAACKIILNMVNKGNITKRLSTRELGLRK